MNPNRINFQAPRVLQQNVQPLSQNVQPLITQTRQYEYPPPVHLSRPPDVTPVVPAPFLLNIAPPNVMQGSRVTFMPPVPMSAATYQPPPPPVPLPAYQVSPVKPPPCPPPKPSDSQSLVSSSQPSKPEMWQGPEQPGPFSPPPLFRPGPQPPYRPPCQISPSSQDEKRLIQSEKEELYRKFGAVLQQHGPMEVTDKRLLSIFMGLTPWMRQGIKLLGGLKDFFRQAPSFRLHRDTVALAWQELDKQTNYTSRQECSGKNPPISTSSEKVYQPREPAKSDSTKPIKSLLSPTSQEFKPSTVFSKERVKDPTGTADQKSSETEESDEEWEGEKGWWLFDPVPGEEDEWSTVFPLQGRIGGGYYDDLKKLEAKEPEVKVEAKEDVIVTSTPTSSRSATSRRSEDKADDSMSPGTKTRTPTPLSWDDSANAQERGEDWESDLNEPKAEPPDKEESEKEDEKHDGDTSKEDVKEAGEACKENVVEEDEGGVEEEKEPIKPAAEDSAEEVAEDDEKGAGEDYVYRPGSSLQQAEDDVILVEVMEEGESSETSDFKDAEECQKRESETEQDVQDVETLEEVEETEVSNSSEAVVQPQPESDPKELEDKQEADTKPEAGGDDNGVTILFESVSTNQDRSMMKIVRSVGMVTSKAKQAHKAVNTNEIKTRSCKVNTMQVPMVSQGVETGEDPEMDALRKNIAREIQRNSLLSADVEELRDKLVRQKHQHASEMMDSSRKLEQATKEAHNQRRTSASEKVEDLRETLIRKRSQSELRDLNQKVEQTSKELREYQRKAAADSNELRKVTLELKESENKLTVARSQISRVEKENCSLTKELGDITRQLLDLEKLQAAVPSTCDQNTSTSGLEVEQPAPAPPPAPDNSEEVSLMKIRARSAEQKVLELQYQIAMQSLNKALQESQYVYSVYGNSLLSSSHKEGLRVKWMDYQMYIKEKTDKVATEFYSALKSLQKDVPLTEIPSLKLEHIETFNPYKQSPMGSGDFHFFNAPPPAAAASATAGSTTSQASADQLFNTQSMPAAASTGAGMNMYLAPSFNAATTQQHNSGNLLAGNAAGQSLGGIFAGMQSGTFPDVQASVSVTQRPPGLSNLQMAPTDMSMSFLQAHTQKAAPGKVMRRVPRKQPKAFLAANFMSSVHHTTKVYGAAKVASDGSSSTAGLAQGTLGRRSPSNVTDWLDGLDNTEGKGQDISKPPESEQNPREVTSAEPNQHGALQNSHAQKESEAVQTTVAQPNTHMGKEPSAACTSDAQPKAGLKEEPKEAQGSVPGQDTHMQEEPRSDQSLVAQQLAISARNSLAKPLGIGRGRPFAQRSTAGTGPSTLNQASVAISESMLGQDASSKETIPGNAFRPKLASLSSISVPTDTTGSLSGLSSLGSSRSASPLRLDEQGDQKKGFRATEEGAKSIPSLLDIEIRPAGQGDSTTSQGASATRQPRTVPSASHKGHAHLPPRFRARQTRMPYHRGVGDDDQAKGSRDGPGGGDSGGEGWTTKLSRRKRKALNLAEQQNQLLREYRTLAGLHKTKGGSPSKAKQQSKKHSSLDKLLSYLSKQFTTMTRKQLTDAILQVRLDHDGSLSGISMGTIVSEASNFLTRSQQKQQQKVKGTEAICVVCQDDMEGNPNTRKLDCGHSFHDKCIKLWVNKEERTCPVCRCHTLFSEEFPRLN